MVGISGSGLLLLVLGKSAVLTEEAVEPPASVESHGSIADSLHDRRQVQNREGDLIGIYYSPLLVVYEEVTCL